MKPKCLCFIENQLNFLFLSCFDSKGRMSKEGMFCIVKIADGIGWVGL